MKRLKKTCLVRAPGQAVEVAAVDSATVASLWPMSLVAGLTEGGLVEWVRESDARVAVLDARFVSHDI